MELLSFTSVGIALLVLGLGVSIYHLTQPRRAAHRKRSKITSKLSERTGQIRDDADRMRDRFKILDLHLQKYFQTLSGSAQVEKAKFESLLSEIMEFSLTLDVLIEKDKLKTVYRLLNYLEGKIEDDAEALKALTETYACTPYKSWKLILEESLNKLGVMVARVSIDFNSLRAEAIRSRQFTLENLEEAGIDLSALKAEIKGASATSKQRRH